MIFAADEEAESSKGDKFSFGRFKGFPKGEIRNPPLGFLLLFAAKRRYNIYKTKEIKNAAYINLYKGQNKIRLEAV